MLPLRYERRWRLSSIVILLMVFAAALAPDPWGDLDAPKLLYQDKWLHAMTFAALAIWFAGQYPRESYWRVAVGLLAFGALIEICQRLLPYRSAEWLDFFADGIGVLAGLLLGVAGLGGWSQRLEQRRVRRSE